MAVDSPTRQAGPRRSRRAALDTSPFRYSVYGLRVQSDFRLPIESQRIADARPADVIYRRARLEAPVLQGTPVAELRCEHGDRLIGKYEGDDGAWFWTPILTCHIAAGAQRVDVYPHPGVDEELLGLVLASHISICALQLRGCPSLHSSAVVTPFGAVAFVGPAGQGKSTMASGFLRRGATLLTDDALALWSLPDGICGAPGPAMMKLWHESAVGALGLVEELPNLVADFEKKLLTLDGRYPIATAPARMRAIYVLDRFDPSERGTECTIERLSPRAGITTLLDQTNLNSLLQAGEAARFLPVYARLAAQAPLRVLHYPHGFEHQDAVQARILADLEETA